MLVGADQMIMRSVAFASKGEASNRFQRPETARSLYIFIYLSCQRQQTSLTPAMNRYLVMFHRCTLPSNTTTSLLQQSRHTS